MSIETLMSAANAAGYVMAAEEELPAAFGAEPEVLEYKTQPTTAIAIWRPVIAELDGKPMAGYFSNAWGWVTGRFSHHGFAA
jgi:hypothetical protein